MTSRLNDLHLALFFTRGIGLKTWAENGSLEREVELYRRLRPRLGGLSFVTYGDASDVSYAAGLPGIDILCNQQNLPVEDYLAALPELHREKLQAVQVIKTNQIPGAEAAIAASRRYGARLVARCGYLWSQHAEHDHGPGHPAVEAARQTEQAAFSAAHQVVVTTPAMQYYVSASYAVPARRIQVIPNYVLTDLFRPLPDVKPVRGRLCFVGRGAPEKNLPVLFQALAGLPVELVLIGSADKVPELRALATALGLNVQFRGNLPHAGLPAEINQAEAYISPSLIEGHPKALLEAMACGRPVIATHVPGVRELIVHGQNGYLCEPEPAALRGAVEAVLRDPGLAARLGQRGRAFVEDYFSLDRVLEQELAMLARVADKPGTYSFRQRLARWLSRGGAQPRPEPAPAAVRPAPESTSRTIICLGVKRSGTTALHHVFAMHPAVRVCHPDPQMDNWEPNFWNLAAQALSQGPVDAFRQRLAETAPGLAVPEPLTEAAIFDLWDTVVARYGPVVFDKSPQYLGSRPGLELLLKYIGLGRQVSVFGIVRDPRDTITSQYELWHAAAPHLTPEVRDSNWVDRYQTFEWFQDQLGRERCLLIRYEDLARWPSVWMPFLLDYCGVADHPASYAHIRPVSVGRHRLTTLPELQNWRPSAALIAWAARYGYQLGTFPSPAQPATAPASSSSEVAAALAAQLLRLANDQAAALPADEALRFLFRLDAALYVQQGLQAIRYDGGVHTKHRHIRYHDFFVRRVRAGERVLDIGCGTGAVAYDLAAQAGAAVTGIDQHAPYLEQAQARYAHPRVRYLLGDALTDLPAERFDVMVMSNVLEHLEHRVDFLRRVQARYQPARWLIRVPVFERDWRVPLKQELGLDYRLDPTHFIEYTLETFADEMRQAGLAITHQEVRWGEIWAEAAHAP